jgi:hypothetical protein
VSNGVSCVVYVSGVSALFWYLLKSIGINCQQWNRSCQVYAFYTQMGLWNVS